MYNQYGVHTYNSSMICLAQYLSIFHTHTNIRGGFDLEKIMHFIEEKGINQLYIIGGMCLELRRSGAYCKSRTDIVICEHRYHTFQNVNSHEFVFTPKIRVWLVVLV